MASSDRSEWKARIERALSELKEDSSGVMRDTRCASVLRESPKAPNDSCASR